MDKMKDYLDISINHHIRRGEHLIESIPHPNLLPQEFHRLIQTTNTELETIIWELRKLRDGKEMQNLSNQRERLRRFRRWVEHLDLIENTAVAALTRRGENDLFLCKLVEKISSEINYPLLYPIVSSLSQTYFHIYPFLNLLFVPLAEASFLLHLPDLYHELGHPLVTAKLNPKVKPFQSSLNQAFSLVFAHIERERILAKRSRGPNSIGSYIDLWAESWMDWIIEFFCDLVAIYTLGPAFAWSHIHLCAKSTQSPFQVPIMETSIHPADDARMRVMLQGLRLIDFETEANQIQDRWQQLLATSGVTLTAEYQRCFPDEILREIVVKAYEGVFGMGLQIAKQGETKVVAGFLNKAWQVFWTNPSSYLEWEEQIISSLKSSSTNTNVPF
jgi:hypothetical protein